MKTVLKYDSQIQSFTIALFLLSFILIKFFNEDIVSRLIVGEFFLIAIVQYTNNLIKFFSKEYPRTDSRYVYIFLSSYVVIGFIILVLLSVFDIARGNIPLRHFFELVVISWMILSPILIIQSLLISYSDKNLNNEKPNI